ncbi:HAD family hydrolase [Alteribacillus sp. HJP-4]|uniref:HAD family hydrolase n=1 Tax=Alteribacillus sp. HJP-4 TaxID=2775394 RepID=UPI0035CD1B4B
MKKKAIIFDMDGTLFDSRDLLSHAIENTLMYAVDKGMYLDKGWTKEEQVDIIGLRFHEGFQRLMPDASDETLHKLEPVMDGYILSELNKGQGQLLPGVKDSLTKLADMGYPMFVASNGNAEYVPAALERENLALLFEGIYSAQEYETKSKIDVVKMIAQQAGSEAVMVGDRFSDIEAGKENKLFTIGCSFGYAKSGELDEADILVDHFSEIVHLISET